MTAEISTILRISGKHFPSPSALSKMTGHCAISNISINYSETDGINSINTLHKISCANVFTYTEKPDIGNPRS